MKQGRKKTTFNIGFTVFSAPVYFIFSLLVGQASAHNEKINVVTENLPPLQMNNAQGFPSGAMVDVVKATLEQANVEGEISIFPWARSYTMALTQPNTLIFSMMKNANRANKFHWIGKIYHGKVYLINLSSG